MTVQRLDEIADDAGEAKGVTIRRLKRLDDVELKAVDVPPGNATSFHQHPHTHEGVVVSGTGVLRLTDRSEFLDPGYVFSTDPNQPHVIENRGTEPLRLVCMDCFV